MYRATFPGAVAHCVPQCEIMADQASAKGVLPYQAAFLRAASTWKVGTDGFSGAEHNCNAYGFCGAVSHSFLLSANEKQALQRAAGLAASTCPADACEDEAALVRPMLHVCGQLTF